MARRLLLPCIASLLLYWTVFALVLDRPLSLGSLRHRIDSSLARGAAQDRRKLVLIAGSNGPFSHRCETIEPLLDMPCVNAGIAVGIGLDYLFARWRPLLKSGDVVYLPLEEAQYTRSESALGPDAAIMFRHDRATLAALETGRWPGAAFASNARDLVMGGIETVLVYSGFHDPRAEMGRERNAWGDRAGHRPGHPGANPGGLAHAMPRHETGERVAAGGGSAIVGGFLRWADAHGVTVIGGLPAGFADSPIPAATRAAMADVFQARGARFIDPGDRARYPRSAFFDSPDHLAEPAQIEHSRLIAAELALILAPVREASR